LEECPDRTMGNVELQNGNHFIPERKVTRTLFVGYGWKKAKSPIL
jgi:hypothetical protein